MNVAINVIYKYMDIQKEKEIIEKSKLDKSSFSQIYKEYVKDIYGYAYSLVENQNEAEEVTSNTFLKALEKLSTFESKDKSIKAWLFTIARNVVYDNYRKARELPVSDKIEDFPEISDSNVKTDTKLQNDIKDLLKDLPEVTKEIIILKIWDEYKFKEIAKIINKDEDAVKKQFYRGIEKLKGSLEEKGYDKYLVTLPILFGSISQLKNFKEFIPSEEIISEGLKKISKFSKVKGMNNLSKPMQYVIGSIAIMAVFAFGAVVGFVASENDFLKGENELTNNNEMNEEEEVENENTSENNEDLTNEEETDKLVYKDYSFEIYEEVAGNTYKFNVKIPEGTVINHTNEGLPNYTFTYNNSKLTVERPYEAYDFGISSSQKICKNSRFGDIYGGFYAKGTDKKFYYMNTFSLSLDEKCEGPDGSINPPCGSGVIGEKHINPNVNIIMSRVYCESQDNNYDFCNSVVESLSFDIK